MTAAGVVAAYTDRARFGRAETAEVCRPRWLPDLLRSARHVAEIPCATGHFLDTYVQAGATVTLVDASPAMLASAVEHAAATGLAAERTASICGYIEELTPLDEVDLVVVPNAALNQLACQAPLVEVLAALRRAVRGGVPLVAQVMCVHQGDRVDPCGFYDPARRHGVWFTDRRLDPTMADGAVARQRRQHRDGDQLSIGFAYHDSAGQRLHETAVDLRVFAAADIEAAFIAAGFCHVWFLPGLGCLSEVLANTEAQP